MQKVLDDRPYLTKFYLSWKLSTDWNKVLTVWLLIQFKKLQIYIQNCKLNFLLELLFFMSLGQTTISKSSPGICSNCKYGLSLWRKTYGIVLNNIIKGNLFFWNWGRVHMVIPFLTSRWITGIYYLTMLELLSNIRSFIPFLDDTISYCNTICCLFLNWCTLL